MTGGFADCCSESIPRAGPFHRHESIVYPAPLETPGIARPWSRSENRSLRQTLTESCFRAPIRIPRCLPQTSAPADLRPVTGLETNNCQALAAEDSLSLTRPAIGLSPARPQIANFDTPECPFGTHQP